MKQIIPVGLFLALVAGAGAVSAADEAKTPDKATACPNGVATEGNTRPSGDEGIDRGPAQQRRGSDIDRGPSSSTGGGRGFLESGGSGGGGGGRGDSAP